MPSWISCHSMPDMRAARSRTTSPDSRMTDTCPESSISATEKRTGGPAPGIPRSGRWPSRSTSTCMAPRCCRWPTRRSFDRSPGSRTSAGRWRMGSSTSTSWSAPGRAAWTRASVSSIRSPGNMPASMRRPTCTPCMSTPVDGGRCSARNRLSSQREPRRSSPSFKSSCLSRTRTSSTTSGRFAILRCAALPTRVCGLSSSAPPHRSRRAA